MVAHDGRKMLNPFRVHNLGLPYTRVRRQRALGCISSFGEG